MTTSGEAAALQRLLRDCRSGGIGVVIIPTLDRLSRNVRLAETLFFKFERLGVQVLIADMPGYNGKDRKDCPHPPDPRGDRGGEPEGHH